MNKTVQYFTEEHLRRCEGMTPDQVIEFLENWRMLFSNADASARVCTSAIPEMTQESTTGARESSRD
jgi:hypothetical protein